jgi:hypothetical protein
MATALMRLLGGWKNKLDAETRRRGGVAERTLKSRT